MVRDLSRAVGLDAEATAAAMTSPDYLARIEATRQEANRLGVTGIPTFFIGTQRIVGCQPYEVLAAAVERSR